MARLVNPGTGDILDRLSILSLLLTPEHEERFLSKFLESNRRECWPWIGTLASKTGYPVFWLAGAYVGAHRLSYIYHRGLFDLSLTIDHKCDNKICANPWHLEPASFSANSSRKHKLRCKHGHEYTPENTYNWKNGKGRQCRTCQSRRSAERWERIKAWRDL